ncbi:MAG: hypothetical protein QXQ68_07435 [Candidatus Nitrosocaldaceae archaeon]
MWVQDAVGIAIFPNNNRTELEKRINTLRINPNEVNTSVTMIFGDYTSAARIIFSIITGESVFFVLQQIPLFANYYVYILITILYTFGTVMLILYILGNRLL